LLRDRVTWVVTAFMGVQSLTYYVGLPGFPPSCRRVGYNFGVEASTGNDLGWLDRHRW